MSGRLGRRHWDPEEMVRLRRARDLKPLATGEAKRSRLTMTVSHTFVIVVDDQDKALAFYRDVLGLQVVADAPLGPMRWLTVGSPDRPVPRPEPAVTAPSTRDPDPGDGGRPDRT